MNQNQLQQSDYESFHEILDDLMKPIRDDGLNVETVIRLYESKLAYLENIRIKCFRDVNARTLRKESNGFQVQDYELIIAAIDLTRKTLKYTILTSVRESLSKIA